MVGIMYLPLLWSHLPGTLLHFLDPNHALQCVSSLTENIKLGFRLTFERHLELNRGFRFCPRILRCQRHLAVSLAGCEKKKIGRDRERIQTRRWTVSYEARAARRRKKEAH